MGSRAAALLADKGRRQCRREREPRASAADQGTMRGGSKPGILSVSTACSSAHEAPGDGNADEAADAR